MGARQACILPPEARRSVTPKFHFYRNFDVKPESMSFSVKLTIFMIVNFFEVTDLLAYGGSIHSKIII